MRRLSALVLIAALGSAGAAVAQPVAPLPAQAQPPGSPKTDPATANADADKALAMAMRTQKEQDERIARIACAAGDTSKCPQPEKAAPAAPKTPQP